MLFFVKSCNSWTDQSLPFISLLVLVWQENMPFLLQSNLLHPIGAPGISSQVRGVILFALIQLILVLVGMYYCGTVIAVPLLFPKLSQVLVMNYSPLLTSLYLKMHYEARIRKISLTFLALSSKLLVHYINLLVVIAYIKNRARELWLHEKLKFLWILTMLTNCIDNNHLPHLKMVETPIDYNSVCAQCISM